MLQISRTCVPNRAVALDRETMTEAVEEDVELDVEQLVVGVAVLALGAASGDAGSDHTRGRVI